MHNTFDNPTKKEIFFYSVVLYLNMNFTFRLLQSRCSKIQFRIDEKTNECFYRVEGFGTLLGKAKLHAYFYE